MSPIIHHHKNSQVDAIIATQKAWATDLTSGGSKLLNPKHIHILPISDITKVGGAWCANEQWGKDIQHKKYNRLRKKFQNPKWRQKHPLLISFSSDGIVTLSDGNHRLLLALEQNLCELPVKFFYITPGDKLYPQHWALFPKRWDGRNLSGSCFPRGTCRTCYTCIGTTEKFKTKC